MKASWNGRHSGGSTCSGSMPCSIARRWRAARAIARFASLKAWSTTGSSNSFSPASIRSAASFARPSSVAATSACGRFFGAASRCFFIHSAYRCVMGASFVRSVATSSTSASAFIPNSTPVISSGSTRSTSACGTHVVATREHPSGPTDARVDVPCPTACSMTSRYWRSAIRSSGSSSSRPRGFGLGINGRSASSVRAGLKGERRVLQLFLPLNRLPGQSAGHTGARLRPGRVLHAQFVQRVRPQREISCTPVECCRSTKSVARSTELRPPPVLLTMKLSKNM